MKELWIQMIDKNVLGCEAIYYVTEFEMFWRSMLHVSLWYIYVPPRWSGIYRQDIDIFPLESVALHLGRP